ncbi:conserved hypothetical protein [Methanocella paludicola SANAE]|uniref:Uncharacterized protein n=1 Tax=Methanocella paludicola (strain DSM 17711 / JCM 13418 / NBRC 101707 / SANAE) TaxID=304371 RepID=D1YY99_METPS|nr:hypothetical protein [Methanocella paludicola]BAI61421.1 conserved hypothetical protein [Methanocella paludicola SANAE]
MKVFDTVDLKIEKIEDSVGILFPIEYEALEGLDAEFSAGVEGDELVLKIRPQLNDAVRETVNELWRGLRILFSMIGDIGDTPWDELEIVWKAPHVYEEKVPISASEAIVHRHIRAAFGKEQYLTSDKEDMRKSIHDTITKLGELASLRLGFGDELFARAFGQAVGNSFSCNTTSLYGMYDIVFEIFNEEFVKVDDDRFWKLTSEAAQKAVKAAYDRIRYLSEHREEYENEKARVEKKWGVWINPA